MFQLNRFSAMSLLAVAVGMLASTHARDVQNSFSISDFTASLIPVQHASAPQVVSTVVTQVVPTLVAQNENQHQQHVLHKRHVSEEQNAFSVDTSSSESTSQTHRLMKRDVDSSKGEHKKHRKHKKKRHGKHGRHHKKHHKKQKKME